jgi:MFS family permease
MNTLGCFFILLLVDSLGRKSTIQVATVVIITGVVAAAFIDSFYMKMLFLGLANGCEGCFSNIFNILMNESARKFSSIFSTNLTPPSDRNRAQIKNGSVLSTELLFRLHSAQHPQLVLN